MVVTQRRSSRISIIVLAVVVVGGRVKVLVAVDGSSDSK